MQGSLPIPVSFIIRVSSVQGMAITVVLACFLSAAAHAGRVAEVDASDFAPGFAGGLRMPIAHRVSSMPLAHRVPVIPGEVQSLTGLKPSLHATPHLGKRSRSLRLMDMQIEGKDNGGDKTITGIEQTAVSVAPVIPTGSAPERRILAGQPVPYDLHSAEAATANWSGLCPPGMALELGETEEGVPFARLNSPLISGQKRKMVYNGEVADWRLDDVEFNASFSLPDQDTKFDILKEVNPMERDSRIEFSEREHTYVIDKHIQAPRSVTELVYQFQGKFDAPLVIQKMKAGKKWKQKRKDYLKPNGEEMTSEEIQKKWKDSGDMSCKRGTLLHWACEMLLNGAQIHGPFSTEFEHFLQFYRDFMLVRGLVPVRTELSVFHTGLACAGQIDLLAKYHGTDSYVIIDWKRSKKIKKRNIFQKLLPPLDHLEDTNLNTYSLQLNMYKYILESEYGLRVDECYLVVLHENNEAAKVIQVQPMPAAVEKIVEYEKAQRRATDPTPGEGAAFNLEHMHNFPPKEEEEEENHET